VCRFARFTRAGRPCHYSSHDNRIPLLATRRECRPLGMADPTMPRSHRPRFTAARSKNRMRFMMTDGQRVVLVSQNNVAADGPRPQVLVAYEDWNMALRATNVLALIAREAGDSLEIQFSMWRFDSFNSPSLREMAARHAQQADIIVVALGSSGDGLSAPVTVWLEQWTGRRQPRPGALVALFDPGTGQHHTTSVVGRQLQAVARSTGMDFFCSALRQFDAVSADRGEPSGATESAGLPDKPSPSSPCPVRNN